jgi:hypothetical protein
MHAASSQATHVLKVVLTLYFARKRALELNDVLQVESSGRSHCYHSLVHQVTASVPQFADQIIYQNE